MKTEHHDLLDRLFHLSRLLRQYHMQSHKNFGPMATPYRGQGRILALLKIKPEINQKDLARILGIRSQSLGELLVKLEKSGLITRAPSETDRRIMEIRLTEAGRVEAEKSEERTEGGSLFECLNSEELTSFQEYLDRLILALEDQLDKDGPGRDFAFRPDFEGLTRFFGGSRRGPFGDHGYPNPFEDNE